MKLIQKVLSRVNGLHYRQEYLCLQDGFTNGNLHAYLVTEKMIRSEVTGTHLFVGYHPLIIAIPRTGLHVHHLLQIDLAFSVATLIPNEEFREKDAIAVIGLRKIREEQLGTETVDFFEGTSGKHRFLSNLSQRIIALHNRVSNQKTGNVYLDSDLYRQVQIAYAIPRNISLITVADGEYYNLFPTDLHGPIGQDHYIISLRHKGKASQQVMDTRRILVSRIDAGAYQAVYGLGKNHMREMRPQNEFPFSGIVSGIVGLPVPERAVGYRELELSGSFEHGIHRLLLFRTLSQTTLDPGLVPLTHVHNVYATWRHNNRLPGNYLFR